MKIQLICEYCRQLYLGYEGQRFCSKRCANRYTSKDPVMNARRHNEKWRQAMRLLAEKRKHDPEYRKQRQLAGLKRRFLTYVEKSCEHCGKQFIMTEKYPRRYCSQICANRHRYLVPGYVRPPMSLEQRTRISQLKKERDRLHPEYAQRSSERMKKNNPSRMPGVVEKILATKRRNGTLGFISRGGHPKKTREQEAVAQTLNLPMEFPICTKSVIGLLPSLPHCYLVDIADPVSKVAIEIDGGTHDSKHQKFIDKRKETVLEALGWKVLRFLNSDVQLDLEGVVKEIKQCITLRLKRIITTS